jgi:hypothetical protein
MIGRRPLLAPGRSWFLLFDLIAAVIDRWLARRERR